MGRTDEEVKVIVLGAIDHKRDDECDEEVAQLTKTKKVLNR
jgi:hypothetical protein